MKRYTASHVLFFTLIFQSCQWPVCDMIDERFFTTSSPDTGMINTKRKIAPCKIYEGFSWNEMSTVFIPVIQLQRRLRNGQ